MADIFWKTWEMDCFHEGSQAFFDELSLPTNPYFESYVRESASIHQVILLSCLPRDYSDFQDWLRHGGKKWFDFFSSLSNHTTLFSSQNWSEEISSFPVQMRNPHTEYVKNDPPTQAEPLFSTTPVSVSPKLKSAYLPTILLDAERIIPITWVQQSIQFGHFSVISSLYHLLPTMSQVEIQLFPNKTLQAEALIQAVTPLLKKISLSLNIHFSPTPFMVLSNDAVSADAYSAMLNGVRISSVPFLKAASRKKLGISDVLMIHNRSERFHKALNQKQTRWGRWSSVRIHHDKCNLCCDCMTICPFQALSLSSEEKIIWRSSVCNRCGICIDICPKNAIN